MSSYIKLKKIFQRISQLHYIQRLLMWDEAVMMPEGAGAVRGQALATLNSTTHKMLISKRTQRLLNELKNIPDLPAWDIANLIWMEKKYQSAACISSRLMEDLTTAALACEQNWRKMRAQNNWQDFYPYLEKVFHLTQEIAKRRSDALQLSPYDAMLDEYAPGFNQHSIDLIFTGLKNKLPALIQKITLKQQADQIIKPVGPFGLEKQKQLGLSAMRALCFDFQHGRLDVSHHPFCSGGPRDVRMTTRYTEHEFLGSLFGICHETGHALYEQGLPLKWIDQPVGQIHSMAQHESQSLLIEMEVCRSLAFNEYLITDVREQFGEQSAFTAANLYKLLTEVRPDFIRVDADEVTYPLHVILRYEIEKGLFNHEISLRDLPQYWDESMQKYLALSTKDNYRDGVMQDVHWPSGAFGYFPAYTLGRLMASQFFAAYKQQSPHYEDDFRRGNFKPLHSWLKVNIYEQASFLSTNELLQKTMGKALDPNYFLQHIEARYLKN